MSDTVLIRILGTSDAPVLERVETGVFDFDVDPNLTAEFLADPRHHMVVALVDDRVVGMASAVHYVHPDKATEFWVNEVGVAPSHQRRGIGRKLLSALLDHGRALGCRTAWLGTEEDNTAARRLYAGAGGKEEPMIYVTFQLDSAS